MSEMWDDLTQLDEIYSFEICPYGPTPSQDNASVELEDGESVKTSEYRHVWEAKMKIHDHYVSQYKELKKERHVMVDRVSKGLGGDIPTTMKYLAAIRKAEEDLQILKKSFIESRDQMEKTRWLYLSARNNDDRRAMQEASRFGKAASKRLANTDPDNVDGIRAEQALIRDSKAKSDAYRNALITRGTEMASLGDVARVPIDVEEVSTEDSESDEDAPTTQSTTNAGTTGLKAKGQASQRQQGRERGSGKNGKTAGQRKERSKQGTNCDRDNEGDVNGRLSRSCFFLTYSITDTISC